LNHLKREFGADFGGSIKVDKGQGKSPKDIAQRLINKHLRVGNYDRSLLLLDSDVPINIPAKQLKENQITLIQSAPVCIEGFFLKLLEELPKGGAHQSASGLKSAMRKILGCEEKRYGVTLAKKCPELFPRDLLLTKREQNDTMSEILEFLSL
jgi:hypothetical protein